MYLFTSEGEAIYIDNTAKLVGLCLRAVFMIIYSIELYNMIVLYFKEVLQDDERFLGRGGYVERKAWDYDGC